MGYEAIEQRQQPGFSLIELIAVIVILGAIAALALPRFVGLRGEAQAASVDRQATTLATGAAMNRSARLTRGLGPSATKSEVASAEGVEWQQVCHDIADMVVDWDTEAFDLRLETVDAMGLPDAPSSKWAVFSFFDMDGFRERRECVVAIEGALDKGTFLDS